MPFSPQIDSIVVRPNYAFVEMNCDQEADTVVQDLHGTRRAPDPIVSPSSSRGETGKEEEKRKHSSCAYPHADGIMAFFTCRWPSAETELHGSAITVEEAKSRQNTAITSQVQGLWLCCPLALGAGRGVRDARATKIFEHRFITCALRAAFPLFLPQPLRSCGLSSMSFVASPFSFYPFFRLGPLACI